MENKYEILLNFHEKFASQLEYYGPKIIGALAILAMGVIIAVLVYKFIIYIFRKFKIIELLDKLDFVGEVDKEITKKINKNQVSKGLEEVKKVSKKISTKIKIDQIVAKSASYYVFLVFFRLSIVSIGITEVEEFLGDIINYLPSLFIAIIIGFFGIRFANFIYDVVYQALNLAKQKAGNIIASGAKIIILFFTFMLVINYTKIVDEFIINSILVGFISMLTIAGGLAFGLGGKEIAREILESFRK